MHRMAATGERSMDISQILARAVQFFPQRTACVSGDTRLTYRDLQARVYRLANVLQHYDIGKGDRVAVLSVTASHTWRCTMPRQPWEH